MNISEKPANFGSNNRLRAFALAWCNTFSTIYQLFQRTQLNPAWALDIGVLLCVWLHGFNTTIIRLLPRPWSRISLIEKPEQLVFTHLHLEHITMCLCVLSLLIARAQCSRHSPSIHPQTPAQKMSKSNEMLYRQRHCAYWTWLPPDQRKLKEHS